MARRESLALLLALFLLLAAILPAGAVELGPELDPVWAEEDASEAEELTEADAEESSEPPAEEGAEPPAEEGAEAPAEEEAGEAAAEADAREESVWAEVPNPAYEPVLENREEPEESVWEQAMGQRTPSLHYCASLEEMGLELRAHMKSRDDQFVIGYVSSRRLLNSETDAGKRAELIALVQRLAEIACAHTGSPAEGDYLRWQYYMLNTRLTVYPEEGLYYQELTFLPEEGGYGSLYYTSAAQEAWVDQRIAGLRRELFAASVSDYEKVRSAYGYITSHVSYDHDVAEKEAAQNYLPFTCYAALRDGKAVCQGYALLFYRLMLEEGIDCRIITGWSGAQYHAWNIVRLGSLYYNLDATWDAGSQSWSFFLRGEDSFPDHVRDHDENRDLIFDDEAFYRAYPMSDGDYYPLQAPASLQCSGYVPGMLLTWSAVDGAQRYQIWVEEDGVWSSRTATDKTTLLLPGLTPGETYSVGVSCVDDEGSQLSPRRTLEVTYTLRAAPALGRAECEAKGVALSWKGVAGAERYRVLCKRGSGGWNRVGETTGTTFHITGLTSGEVYTFTVRCVSADGRYDAGGYDTAGRSIRYLSMPVLKKVSVDDKGRVQVSWNSVRGAERYRVFYKSGSGSWKAAGTTTASSYSVKGLKTGKRYTFTVRCVTADKKPASAFDSTGRSVQLLAKPSLTAAQSVKGGVSLKWKPVKGAVRYRVYYKSGSGNWRTAGTVKAARFTVTGLKSGIRYAFSVRCVSADGKTALSGLSSAKGLTYVAAPTLLQPSVGKGAVTVRWNRVSGGTRYRVYYRTGKTGWKKAGDTTDRKLVVKGLKSGVTYRFTVRCVSADGKTFLSGFDQNGVKARCK